MSKRMENKELKGIIRNQKERKPTISGIIRNYRELKKRFRGIRKNKIEIGKTPISILSNNN